MAPRACLVCVGMGAAALCLPAQAFVPQPICLITHSEHGSTRAHSRIRNRAHLGLSMSSSADSSGKHGHGSETADQGQRSQTNIGKDQGVGSPQNSRTLQPSNDDDDDDVVTLPPLEVEGLRKMDAQEREELWNQVKLKVQKLMGPVKPGPLAADGLRREIYLLCKQDPYLTLEAQYQQAIKNEQLMLAARLKMEMLKVGKPPVQDAETDEIMEDSLKLADGLVLSTVSDTTTNGIRVQVRSQYYPAQSVVSQNQFIFLYTVRVTNQSPETVQLVSRKWEIKTADRSQAPQVVEGSGVVGQQPVLSPGEAFEYSSATPIQCAPEDGLRVVGAMQGSYLMVAGALGEKSFSADIAPFHLLLPQAVADAAISRNRNKGF